MAGNSIMPYQPKQYAEQLAQLMPRGVVWQQLTQRDTKFSTWLAALAEEFARIDARAKDLLDETDPRTLSELLYEWEQYLALPDNCVGRLDTIERRRSAVHEVLTSAGGQSKQYFIDLAKSLDYEVTITEFNAALCGVVAAGDAIYNEDWRFAWQVNAPATTILDAEAGIAGAGEPLRSWGNKTLECVIRSRKPAHSNILFSYGE